jgi:hypothetical protein
MQQNGATEESHEKTQSMHGMTRPRPPQRKPNYSSLPNSFGEKLTQIHVF